MNTTKIALVLNGVAVLCFATALMTQNFTFTALGGIALVGAAVLRVMDRKKNAKE